MIKHFLSLFLFAVFLIPATAHAVNPDLPVRDTRYAAKYVSQSVADPVVIEAGATREVTVTFRNTGEATWQTTGAYATAYAVDPKYRSSAFANSSWIKTSNPAKFAAPVAPGQTGTLTLSLTAPTTPGTYTEEFYLAADNYTWMDNGYFYIKVQVVPATTASAAEVVAQKEEIAVSPKTPESDTEETPVIAEDQISKFFISKRDWETAGGEVQRVRVAFRNITDEMLTELTVVPLAERDAMFASDEWLGRGTIATFADMAPDEVQMTDIFINSPSKVGKYRFDLALARDGEILRGSIFTMDVTVTADAPPSYERPRYALPAVPVQYRMETQPTIRVGLAKIETGSMTFVSAEDTYLLIADGKPVIELAAGVSATLSYNGGVYSYRDSAGQTYQSASYLRLQPANNPDAIFTLGGGFGRDVTWKGRTEFNTYRGSVELRLADDSARTLYAINDLPMEDYTAGVAEVSNSAPTEFLKAQSILARTYAYYIIGTNKYRDRYFDVVAHTGDQLYLGTAIEETTPNYLAAARETRGEMVTYEDNVVITPYFGNSEGTTRGFHEVWGGAVKPWLVSVSAEFDLGRAKYGHGVGMSQRDAMARATNLGATYDELIKHYYTGVEVERMYE